MNKFARYVMVFFECSIDEFLFAGKWLPNLAMKIYICREYDIMIMIIERGKKKREKEWYKLRRVNMRDPRQE